MSEFKGTKGKWINKENPISTNQMYVKSHKSIVCRLNDADFEHETEMSYNALLISKAPEMLEMLKKALIIINDLDAANSDMMNELYQTKVYKNFTKHSVFCDELEQLIKEATEL